MYSILICYICFSRNLSFWKKRAESYVTGKKIRAVYEVSLKTLQSFSPASCNWARTQPSEAYVSIGREWVMITRCEWQYAKVMRRPRGERWCLDTALRARSHAIWSNRNMNNSKFKKALTVKIMYLCIILIKESITIVHNLFPIIESNFLHLAMATVLFHPVIALCMVL